MTGIERLLVVYTTSEAIMPIYIDLKHTETVACSDSSNKFDGRAQYKCLNANKLFDISYLDFLSK